ncbi:hypothetical protein ZHAS_00000616 [Anopheles sinensis]|uniref:Uncharacterized protein n=1 Tax=Anopheles sinensis TaxID=74873 RepID=A0A084VAD6_ANOSI|nr:hypothetical protein ZHAS_00000616 [Anopheles sinensis]
MVYSEESEESERARARAASPKLLVLLLSALPAAPVYFWYIRPRDNEVAAKRPDYNFSRAARDVRYCLPVCPFSVHFVRWSSRLFEMPGGVMSKIDELHRLEKAISSLSKEVPSVYLQLVALSGASINHQQSWLDGNRAIDGMPHPRPN